MRLRGDKGYLPPRSSAITSTMRRAIISTHGRIINKLDQAATIQGYADEFQSLLNKSAPAQEAAV